MATSGQVGAACSTSDSRRRSASRGPLAWHVENDPSWPVFMACTSPSTSGPLISPTISRSGRSRSAVRTSASSVTAVGRSAVAGRASRRTVWRPATGSSAVSSRISTLSSSGTSVVREASSEVLPDEVAPHTRTLHLAAMSSPHSSAPTSSVNEESGRIVDANRRIDRLVPSTATGGTTAHTRAPLARRASTIGVVRSRRRPIGARIRSMSCSIGWPSRTPARSSTPDRSIHISRPRLTSTSSIVGSATSASRSPSPLSRATASRASWRCSAGLERGASRRTSSSTSMSTSPRMWATRRQSSATR